MQKKKLKKGHFLDGAKITSEIGTMNEDFNGLEIGCVLYAFLDDDSENDGHY